MSDIAITVQTIQAIDEHSDADRLEIVKILGTQCVVPKGEYQVGQKVIYFPPDMMIPEIEADRLGVKKYLKHVRWGTEKVQSRIAACRIRGVSSFGFLAPAIEDLPDGMDVTATYRAEQYVAPVATLHLPGIKGGRQFQLEPGDFIKYTNIQAYWRYPGVFSEFGDEEVVITEKIHGTNSRVGVLFEGGEWVYAAGSHKVRWEDAPETMRYWNPLYSLGMMSMLAELCGECANVIVYGEIFGSGIQDLDYGVEGDKGYRVFDIRMNTVFLDWPDVQAHCLKHSVPMVPVLYQGSWSCVSEVLDEYASGLTSVGTPTRKFKGREGIVIKPVLERQTNLIGGRFNAQRAILKYVSADYLNRKGAQDNG